ncbi:EpsG family protein, partial [Bacteroidota bacterium]
MLFYFLIFLLIALFSLYKNEQTKNIFFICCGLLLFFIAAFRGDIDNDYQGYVNLYNQAATLTIIRIEPTFLIISFIVKHLFNNVVYLFIIYSLLGVCIKFYAIKKYTDYYLLSALIYFSNFYIFHEMTQIRVGVASALILLSIVPILDRKFWTFLILIIIAFLFHYSAIIALPLYFLNGRKINVLIFSLVIPVSYLFYFLSINVTFLIDLIPIPEINAKFLMYKELS